MWVNVKYFDGSGNLLVEYGRYGDKQDSIFGKPVTVPTLLDESKTTVYEIIPGLSEAQAKKFGIAAGPSFHFIVNDKIYKDNRIPPRGFKNAEFARHLCEPVGAMYFDGQHWDDVKLDIAKGSAKVIVKLMYQSASWEYIKFLAEENRSDDWGRRLYYGWQETGKCAPEVIAEIEVEVP